MPKNSMKPSGGPRMATNKRVMMAPMNKGTTGMPSGSPSMPNNKEYAKRSGMAKGGSKHMEGPQTKMKMGGDN